MLNLVANGPSGYNLTNSLRFRASASASLTRTMSASGTITTWSMWVKRGTLGTIQALVGFSYSGTTSFGMQFNSDNTLNLYNYSSAFTLNLTTTQVFRDPSAWYHLVFTIDTTQATAANRAKIYVNGIQVTAFGTATYPSQNSSLNIGTSTSVGIGVLNQQAVQYFDGYLAEFNLIDGQALTPSSFGSTNATTGVWQPARYTGSYGTNGFYLKFSDIATTSGSNAGLGKDFSGNTNYWTTNNISVTAGTTYDAMTDVPTLTSATVANYATWNPLDKDTSGIGTSNGNLTVTGSAAGNHGIRTTMYFSSGKWYWENTIGVVGNNTMVGIVDSTWNLSYPGVNANSWGYSNDGTKYNNGNNVAYGASYVAGDIIGIALDLNAGTLTFYKNNTSQGTAATGLTGAYAFAVSVQNTTNVSSNFGQRPFTYTPPTGYVALNTYNLPTPTILQGNKYMDASLWSGDSTSPRTVVSTLNFKPDFVWTKVRTTTYSNTLFDSVRGGGQAIFSDTTGAEQANYTNGYIQSFNSNGWTMQNGGTGGIVLNNSGQNYVAWQWQAGQGSTSSNTSGSITSTVSVNATAGFSIVTYTGNGTAGATVGHGLGVAPKMFIVKQRNAAGSPWDVWHTSISPSSNNTVFLNTTGAATTAYNIWNSTSPTSSVFSIGADASVNQSTSTYVAYCWAEIAGFSKFGSYTGNGSTDGPFVYLGFRPKFVMIKNTSNAGYNWVILDSSRDTYNYCHLELYSNTSGAEVNASSSYQEDFLSNGFKIRQTDITWNGNGSTYIYAAFAENPFKNALAR